MRNILLIIGMIAITFGCQNNYTTVSILPPGVHSAIALEKINTSKYTYLLVNENGIEKWLAIPLAEIKTGETYYYVNEMVMHNFESKELGRTFETVYFLQGVSNEPPTAEKTGNPHNMNPQPMAVNNPHQGNASITPEKVQVKVQSGNGIITIANLVSKKENYAGKKVKIKGQVTKFSPGIMGKNWIHIQDGSDANGVFDITITSQNTVKVGDIVTIEGTVSLNKDFGAGYHYDIILEDGAVK
jgi:hypothetical protein